MDIPNIAWRSGLVNAKAISSDPLSAELSPSKEIHGRNMLRNPTKAIKALTRVRLSMSGWLTPSFSLSRCISRRRFDR